MRRAYMGDLIAAEVTTVPGLVNLAGAFVLVGARSVGSIADRAAVWLLVFDLRRRTELSTTESEQFWELVKSVIPPPMGIGELACVAIIFVLYNIACVLLVQTL